jgi:hypothetical protein
MVNEKEYRKSGITPKRSGEPVNPQPSILNGQVKKENRTTGFHRLQRKAKKIGYSSKAR